MLNTYQFDLLEGWKRIDDPLPPQAEQESWNSYLKRCGYHGFGSTVGNDISWSLTYLSADSSSEVQPRFAYAVEIGNCDEGRLVFCDDFLSAAEVMRLFAPVVIADMLSGANEDLEAFLRNQREKTEQMYREWKGLQSAR